MRSVFYILLMVYVSYLLAVGIKSGRLASQIDSEVEKINCFRECKLSKILKNEKNIKNDCKKVCSAVENAI